MSQLYQGNRYAPAPVEGAPLARNVAAEDIAIGFGRVAQNVDAVSKGLLRHADESRKLDDALELRRVRAEAKTLMEQRLNLPDGDPAALFREDGSPNKQAISELMKPFAARLDKVGRRLMNPDERAQMRFNADAAWVDLENGAYQMAEQASRARRDRKMNAGYQLAMETGDFEGAAMFARAGAETGSWTPEQAELMAFNAGQAGMMDRVSKAYLSPGYEEFLDLYDDPDFRGGLSTDNLMKLDAMASKLMTGPRESVRYTQGADGSMKAQKVVEPPLGLPSYALKCWNKFNGSFKDNPQAQQEAIDVVHQLARGIISQPDDPGEVELLKQRAELFGVSKDYAGALAKRVQDELAGNADYKPGEALDGLGEFAFLTPENARKVESLRADRDYAQRRLLDAKADGDDPKPYFVRRFGQLDAEIKRWEGYAKDETAKAKRAITAKFDAWCMAHPNAEYQQKVEAYWDFVQEYRQEKNRTDDVRDSGVYVKEFEAAGVYMRERDMRREELQKAHDAYIEDVNATDAAALKSRELQGAQNVFDAKAEAAALLDGMGALAVSTDPAAARSFDGNKSECILYVPASCGLKDGSRIVVSTPRDVAAEATVRVQEGVDSVVLSQRLRYSLGCVRPEFNSLSFSGGEARLGVQDGRQDARGLDAASLILRSEARRDKAGRLLVYSPPAGDGGGAYEVAGINAASHPQEAARLRLMVQSGQYAAAEREAKRYIMEYTQPVADFLQGAGVRSKGVDYYLRDVFMNGGAGGAAKVLNRAVGAGGDKLTEESRMKLQEFLRTHSERDLLLRLRDVRLQWYKGISNANPAKKQFMTGWVNRTRQAFESALSFA